MEEGIYKDGHLSVVQQQPPPSSSGSSAPSGPPRPDSASADKKRETRRRTKTGCLTCRKRRIKCDEAKPECMRCVKSKRSCEGYSIKTVFRNENQLHYQQNIRPSNVQATGYTPVGNAIQFSIPQYLPHEPEYNRHHSTFGSSQFTPSNNFNTVANVSSNTKNIAATSRNSSASNGSGISANSEQQRRISVLSLMSEQNCKPGGGVDVAAVPRRAQSPDPIRTVETDARDNFYYNYYISCHAFTLARSSPTQGSAKYPGRDGPLVLWPQTVPSLINEDPPGCRPLFDAVIAYTAHIRFEEIPIDYRPRSTSPLARVIELGLKIYIDIIRGSSETLVNVETIFAVDDSVRAIIRWGILQHTIVSILADTKPRVPWINFLSTKAFGTTVFTPTSEIENFFLGALRHISSNVPQIPQNLLHLQSRYDFLSVPGMDIIYFAFIQDFDALRNIAYHVLSNPRVEFLHLLYKMVNGGRLRGEPDLDLLANELLIASRQGI